MKKLEHYYKIQRLFFSTCVDSDDHLFMLLLAGSGTGGQKCTLILQKDSQK